MMCEDVYLNDLDHEDKLAMMHDDMDLVRSSCQDCKWYDKETENYACSFCPVTRDQDNREDD